LGSDKILKQKKTPGGIVTPGEVLSRVGDHPPGDGVQEETQGPPRPQSASLVTGFPWHRAWN
jgi:hypothetical protein